MIHCPKQQCKQLYQIQELCVSPLFFELIGTVAITYMIDPYLELINGIQRQIEKN